MYNFACPALYRQILVCLQSLAIARHHHVRVCGVREVNMGYNRDASLLPSGFVISVRFHLRDLVFSQSATKAQNSNLSTFTLNPNIPT